MRGVLCAAALFLALPACDAAKKGDEGGTKKTDSPPGDCDCAPCPTCPPCVGDTASADLGDIKVTYRKPKKKEHEAIAKALEADGGIDKMVDAVNDVIALPRDAAVLVAECGEINAYYDNKAPGVVVCYELLAYFEALFSRRIKDRKKLTEAVLGATYFGVLHELGHALVDLLEIPVTGKEEDAVDQLAAVVLIAGGSSGAKRALDGAESFLLQADEYSDIRSIPFWDEHSFEKQRYYEISCLAYGANPKAHGHLVGPKRLPRERAKTCPPEFARVKKAWGKLLAPHAKTD